MYVDAVRNLEVTFRSLGGEARRKCSRTGKVLTVSSVCVNQWVVDEVKVWWHYYRRRAVSVCDWQELVRYWYPVHVRL